MLCLKWEEESLRQEKDLNKARGSYGRGGLAGTADRLTVRRGWWSPFSEQQKKARRSRRYLCSAKGASTIEMGYS